jgi:transposase-like protein
MKILIRWSEDIPQGITISHLDVDHRTYKKVVQKVLSLVKFDFSDNKLGGPDRIVQVDETELNHSVKAHRGRVPHNKTDALCIVEYEYNIMRAFACFIENKKASTILPIICANVASNSIIHADKHKSYSSLSNIGFLHDTVCHKYTFINPETGSSTQAVESFNNCIKLDIKKEKK